MDNTFLVPLVTNLECNLRGNPMSMETKTLKFNKYTVIRRLPSGTDHIFLSTDSLFLAKEEMDDRDKEFDSYEAGAFHIIEDYGTSDAKVIEAYT